MVNNLREIRFKKRISQLKLSKLSGVSRQTIRRMEDDPESNIGVNTLEKLASALDCSIGDLFLP